MPDLTYASRVLLRAISDLKVDAPVRADSVREAFDAANLTSAERSGALRAACNDGFLSVPHQHLPDGSLAVYHVRSSTESRKNAWQMLYARTNKPVPEHVCDLT